MPKTVCLLFFGIFLFISAFSPAAAMAERMAVTGSVANVRSGPGGDYPIIWKIEKYHPVNVIKRSGEWYQFKDFENDTGWVHQSLVGKISTVITKKNKCNIRGGAGTRFDVIFTLDSGVPFKVKKRQGKWIEIEHADGDTGWIHQSLVW